MLIFEIYKYFTRDTHRKYVYFLLLYNQINFHTSYFPNGEFSLHKLVHL